ncbi:hypothetical protein AAVH_37323, partial [Aphelenchoides avenae]
KGVVGWFPLDCNYTEWPTVCERSALKRNVGNEQLKTTDVSGGSSAASAVTPTAGTTTGQDPDTATTAGAKPVNKACKDKAAAWKCKSLTAIYACKAGAYFKYLEENCARSCPFCS